jgi:hypothetical protein
MGTGNSNIKPNGSGNNKQNNLSKPLRRAKQRRIFRAEISARIGLKKEQAPILEVLNRAGPGIGEEFLKALGGKNFLSARKEIGASILKIQSLAKNKESAGELGFILNKTWLNGIVAVMELTPAQFRELAGLCGSRNGLINFLNNSKAKRIGFMDNNIFRTLGIDYIFRLISDKGPAEAAKIIAKNKFTSYRQILPVS